MFAEQTKKMQALIESGAESVKKYQEQVEKNAQRIVDQTKVLAAKDGVPAIIEPLIDVLIDGLTAYSSLGASTDGFVSELEAIRKTAKETVAKGEIITKVPKESIGGFDELEAIKDAASKKSPSLTFNDLAKWIKENKTTGNKALNKETPNIKKVLTG